jgi:hypothetical protein
MTVLARPFDQVRVQQPWPDKLWIPRHGKSAGHLARDAACSAGSARIGIDAELARDLSRASTVFAALYNRSPVGNSYTAGIEPSTASFLQAAAWQTVQNIMAATPSTKCGAPS